MNPQEEKERLTNAMLTTGSKLIAAGSSTNRTRLIIERMIKALGYQSQLLIVHRFIILSIYKEGELERDSRTIETPFYGVNFSVLSALSRMSRNVLNQKWSVSQIEERIERLEEGRKYPLWLVVLIVGVFSAAFSALYQSNFLGGAVAFMAGAIGFTLKHFMMVKHYNHYLCVFCSALLSTCIAGLTLVIPSLKNDMMFDVHIYASLLYLIPGVPLLNAFADLIDGSTLNGVVRLSNAFLILIMSATGMAVGLFIYGKF